MCVHYEVKQLTDYWIHTYYICIIMYNINTDLNTNYVQIKLRTSHWEDLKKKIKLCTNVYRGTDKSEMKKNWKYSFCILVDIIFIAPYLNEEEKKD